MCEFYVICCLRLLYVYKDSNKLAHELNLVASSFCMC